MARKTRKTKKRKTTKPRRDVYQEVTDMMIEALESGTAPWHKPWAGGAPMNAATGRPYRGINIFTLGLAAARFGYSDPRWLTFKQAKDLGGNVREGEKHHARVVFFKILKKEEKDASGNLREQNIPLIRSSPVFNFEQCEGLDKAKPAPDTEAREHEPREAAEALVREYLDNGPDLHHGGAMACYMPEIDRIRMPRASAFASPEHYYATLFHEITHSTGHRSRLNRIEPATFGSHAYSREELVAEMGAGFLGAMAGIDAPEVVENQAAYLAHWIKRLREDKKMVVWAAARASKAVDLVTGADSQENVEAA